MFHAETSAPSALDLPNLISLSTIESPLTPDGDCVAGYRGTDTEKVLDPRKGAPVPSAVTSRASQKRCACPCAFRSRVRLGAVPRHGTRDVFNVVSLFLHSCSCMLPILTYVSGTSALAPFYSPRTSNVGGLCQSSLMVSEWMATYGSPMCELFLPIPTVVTTRHVQAVRADLQAQTLSHMHLISLCHSVAWSSKFLSKDEMN